VCERSCAYVCFAGSTRLQGSLCETQPGNINKNNRHQTKDHATRRVTRIRYVNRLCSLSGMLLSSEFTCFFFLRQKIYTNRLKGSPMKKNNFTYHFQQHCRAIICQNCTRTHTRTSSCFNDTYNPL